VRSLKLTRFKSFSDTCLPVRPLTVLTGRNGSGKSNALDGLDVLCRLAGGEELGDALDSRRREGGPVRGGSRGCAPHGRGSFELGVVVADGKGEYTLDVQVRVHPELRILSERLTGPAPAETTGKVDVRELLRSRDRVPHAPAIDVELFDGEPGRNPVASFRDTRLLTSQVGTRLHPTTGAERAVLHAASAVCAALRGAFHLDPVPHLMREYVPERDRVLRRTAENLSAAVGALVTEDNHAFGELEQLVRRLAGTPVEGLEVTTSPLGDVMLALREQDRHLTPAREMSDGLLRVLAIATTLLTARRGLDIGSGTLDGGMGRVGVQIVLEELENGLHPSQAGHLLELTERTTQGTGTQVLVTTHSPALLNALPGSRVENVMVCYRDPHDGHSCVSPLCDLDGFPAAMASGPLGDAITRGELTGPGDPDQDYGEFNRLLGIE
jgi:predicted ATPase